MKVLHLIVWLLVAFVVGCSGKTETVGNLPNIKVTGHIMGQSLINAEVIFVGIDANGQPQSFNGDYTGDRIYTNSSGYFEGYFNGAYTGPLLVVARKRTGDDQVTSVRCALLDGCRATDGSSAAYGETYAVSDDFEVWSLVHQVEQGMNIEVSWLTHAAAKLAYTSYVTDGTSCTAASCAGVTPVNGLITAQSAYKANDQIKNLFSLSSIPARTNAWYPGMGSTSEDTVQLGQEASHGLLAQQVERVAKDNNETVQEALDRITNEFLANKGQFFEDKAVATEVSLKYLLDQAVVQGQAIQTAGLDHAGVGQAISQFQTLSTGATVGVLTTAVGSDFVENLASQLTEAREFVQQAQVWVADLGSQTSEPAMYASYFGDEMAAELSRVDKQWQTFKDDMVNELEVFYQLQLEMVEYGLSCVRSGLTTNACDTSHRLHGLATFNASASTLSYQTQTVPAYNLVASISTVSASSSTEGDYFYQLSYEQDLTLESATGIVESGAVNEQRAYVQIGLNQPLEAGVTPVIAATGMYFPELTVKAKKSDGSCCESLRFLGEKVVIESVGTKDVTVDNGPVHYNLLTVNLPGYLSEGSLSDADKVELNLIINSDASSASLYYPEQKFPSFDVKIDVSAFQQFAALGDPDFSNTDLAGWLQMRTDITATDPAAPAGEVVYLDELLGEVEYFTESQYSDLDDSLQAILDLPASTTGFEYAGFRYSGGETVLVLWQDPAVTETQKLATQCIKSKSLWSCTINTSVANLGCQANQNLNDVSASVLAAFNYLRDQACIPEVVIEGRGTYTIDYKNGGADVVPFTEGATYNVKLAKPFVLGVDSASLRLLTRFKDAEGEARPIANISVLAQALDVDNVTMGASITEGYEGSSTQDLIGIDWVVPYGENTLWMAAGTGQNAEETDEALAFYIQDGPVTLSLKAFNLSDDPADDIGFIRYAGSLLGSIRKEGNVYVIRYLDDSWQLL